MDEVVIIDCSTGEHVRRPMNASEAAQLVKDDEEAESVKRAKDVVENERNNTLGKVAEAAKIPLADLKRSLGAGVVAVTPDPDKAAKIRDRDKRPT